VADTAATADEKEKDATVTLDIYRFLPPRPRFTPTGRRLINDEPRIDPGEVGQVNEHAET
jgi:hypothetical protein